MTLTDALTLLGLGAEASPSQLKDRYRTLARERHPDAGGSTDSFDSLKRAYDVALDATLSVPCFTCKGDGEVSSFGAGLVNSFNPTKTLCGSCAGTGKQWSAL